MSQTLRVRRNHRDPSVTAEDNSIAGYHAVASLRRFLNPLLAAATSDVATIDWIEACEHCTHKTPLAMIITSDFRKPEKSLQVAALLAQAADLPLFAVDYKYVADKYGNLDITGFLVRRVTPEPTEAWSMTPTEYTAFLLRLRRDHYTTHHRARLHELDLAVEPTTYVRPHMRITDASILYSEWHRMRTIVRYMGGTRTPGALDAARSLMMVDLDSVETCRLCSQPMAIIEYHRPSKTRPEMPKYPAVTRAVGLRAGLPTYSVMNMPTPDGNDITAFHIRALGASSPEEYVRMTPQEYAAFLTSIREAHYREHHRESLNHVGVKATPERYSRGITCMTCRKQGRSVSVARHATVDQVRACHEQHTRTSVT